jgi:hypothetical protein
MCLDSYRSATGGSPVCCGTVCQVPCLACFSSARYPGSCRKRLCLAGGLGGCYSLSEARGGGRGGGGRRAGSLGIGTPPICCTRVEIAVNPFADGFLRITSSMAAIGVALEIHGSRVDSAAAVLRRVADGSITVAPIVGRDRDQGSWLSRGRSSRPTGTRRVLEPRRRRRLTSRSCGRPE